MTESGERGWSKFSEYWAKRGWLFNGQIVMEDDDTKNAWQVWQAAFEAGRGQERKRFDDAGVYFCGCGHTNMEHCADAGWMSDPDVKYPCTLCACQDCALPAPTDSGDKKGTE